MNSGKQSVSILGLSKIFSVITLMLSFVTLWGEYHRYLELFSHFRFQYLAASTLFCVVFIFYKQKIWAYSLLLTLLLNSALVAPLYFSSQQLSSNASVDDTTSLEKLSQLKLVHSNVLTSNTEYQRLIELVIEESPDLLIAQEINQSWAKQLVSLETILPHKLIRARDDNFGIAVYSRFPFSQADFVYLGESNVPSIKLSFMLNGQLVTLIASHPLPPINESFYQTRNYQIKAIAELAKEIETPLILVGDLNITPWSADYQPLIENTDLSNTRDGFGVLPTWPSHFFPAMIPIDHCLVSSEFITLDMRVARDIGSDHLPLVVTLHLNNDSKD